MQFQNLVIATCSLLVTTQLMAESPVNFATKPVSREGEKAKYERHLQFNEIARKGGVELVFLGDSITQGWEGGGKKVWQEFYGQRKAANFGIGGDRTEHVLWRIDHGNFDGLSPKLIVLMIGTNNTGHVGRNFPEIGGSVYRCTPEQTAEGIQLIVTELQHKMPDTNILLLAAFPRGASPDEPMRKANERINESISKLGTKPHVTFLNLTDHFTHDDGSITKDMMRDYLHLTPMGYQVWAEAIEPTIASLLGESSDQAADSE